MIPLKDDVPNRSVPVITLLLIALNVLAFFYQASLGLDTRGPGAGAAEGFIMEFGLVPCRLAGSCAAPGDFPLVLHHEIELLVGEGAGLVRWNLALVTQRQRHLPQLVVEQRVRLVQHAAIGQRTHRERRQRQRGEQRDEQAQADRSHQRVRLPRK